MDEIESNLHENRDHQNQKYVEVEQLHIVSFTSSTTSGINISSSSSSLKNNNQQRQQQQQQQHQYLFETSSSNEAGNCNSSPGGDNETTATRTSIRDDEVDEGARRRTNLLRSIENRNTRNDIFVGPIKSAAAARCENNDENRRPLDSHHHHYRSPTKTKSVFKIRDVPEYEDFKRTIDKLSNELKQQTEMIEQLKNENSILVEQREKINSSLAMNLVDTEHAYHEHERNRLKQILDRKDTDCMSLQSKIEQLEKCLNDERKENVQLKDQLNAAMCQIDRLKRTNKELYETNKFVKMQAENMGKQIEILEQEKVLAAEISMETEKLLKQNVAMQSENASLNARIDALKEEAKKVKARTNEQEVKNKKKIKEYETLLEETIGENKKLNEERASFLKSLQNMQDERDELNRCRENYEKKLDECKSTISNLSALSADQQRRMDSLAESEAAKRDEARAARQAEQVAEERLRALVEQHAKELEETRRRTRVECDKWKKKSDETAARNAELARANTELRSRIHLYEGECKRLVDKCACLKCDLEAAQRQKKDLRDDYERKESFMRKEKELLEQQLKESTRKASAQQEAIERMQKQAETLRVDAQRCEQLEKTAKQAELMRIKYANVKTYIRRMLYESSQMALNGNGNCDWAHGRVQFFTRLIKDLKLDSSDDVDNN